MTDNSRTRNKISGDVRTGSAVVQVHNLMGDLQFAMNPERPAAAVHPRLGATTVEAVFISATALAAVALLSWRYFCLSDSQRSASR
ncbi:hypothetical protein [Lentzea flaviverrucosa]|uniref:Uncharacterized protein n=1 Tax=Lentzea flaviverrucosa TaxID=200379 RepID=A0A1H9WC54_9PSEU|nr:hypothetical protein [Lentzea flaviverrucosa]RDI22202.1 hypothetical protein DFR72_11269 [Lentzea flaviverrucosa]SES31532.1 hypothetical protein SAMN05216195_111237 [Lentzea flaviverrucosa]